MNRGYVDGYVLVVPKKNFNTYKKMATDGARVWKKFGALAYYECVGNELKPNSGGMKMLGFTKLLKLKKNEDVWYSFIMYRNKKHRDAVNKKVMAYFEKKFSDAKSYEMPWDMTKFSYGGFRTVVEK